MTVVYIDALFLLNLAVNYLLLLAAGKLAGEPLHRLRMGAGAALGRFMPRRCVCRERASCSIRCASWGPGC